jgi:predicted lipoprotein with Yx(FWY)xxD motif
VTALRASTSQVCETARDAAPGDTKGYGVKEIWSLAKP